MSDEPRSPSEPNLDLVLRIVEARLESLFGVDQASDKAFETGEEVEQ
jgi:hypothetical protein